MIVNPYSSYFPDQELINAICENRCILFIGAGLSMQANRHKTISFDIDGKIKDFSTTPSWGNLLEIILHNSKIVPSSDWLKEVKTLLENKKYLTLAEELLESADEVALKNIFRQLFDGNLYDLGVAHQLIPSIPFRAAITTNYDNFFNYHMLNLEEL